VLMVSKTIVGVLAARFGVNTKLLYNQTWKPVKVLVFTSKKLSVRTP
jgi:hypothetical protein